MCIYINRVIFYKIIIIKINRFKKMTNIFFLIFYTVKRIKVKEKRCLT